MDDGSTDGTLAVMQSFAASDPRIRVVSAPHRGLVGALNEGLRYCGGEFIARMDADDLMHRERIAAQVSALDCDRTLAAVGCHVRLFPRDYMTPRLREYEGWLNSLCTAEDVERDAFVECPIAHPTLMMRTEVARLGYRDDGWPEDYDLVLRALRAGHRVGVVPRRLHSWRDRKDGLCRTSPIYHVERFTECKAHYLAQGFLASFSQYGLWGYGDTGRLLRRSLAAHGKTPSHIVEVKISRIGQRIHDAPVIDVDSLQSLRGRPIVVSVARAGPRAEIRMALASMSFTEGRDYVCAA